MIDETFICALKTIAFRVKDYKIDWMIIGSTSLVLQGMEFTPKDIDIICRMRDIEVFKEEFRDYLATEPHAHLSPVGTFCKEMFLNVRGVDVQIIGEEENDVYSSNFLKKENIVFVKLEKQNIPCLRLEAEKDAYFKIGRLDKAKKIDEFLKNR